MLTISVATPVNCILICISKVLSGLVGGIPDVLEAFTNASNLDAKTKVDHVSMYMFMYMYVVELHITLFLFL